jgi:16S rRNA (guanine966-N2)-methyltransferase
VGIRLTGGVARGQVLREPVAPGVRPTASRVREALFSIVGQDLTGESVLDAFGGAGIIGLEAWSRGAEVTVFERDRKAAQGIVARGNQVGATWTVRQGDVLRDAPGMGMFDGVYADPPYGTEPAVVIGALGRLAKRWFVLEVAEGTEVPQTAGTLGFDRRRP